MASRACGLTIQSSRRGFATRLISGVSAHMNRKCALAIAFCFICGATFADPPDLGKEATALNRQSKAHLGVSIRALGLLFNAQPGAYALKYGLVRDGSLPYLQDLQRAGLVEVTNVKGLPYGATKNGEYVFIKPTSQGQKILKALSEH